MDKRTKDLINEVDYLLGIADGLINFGKTNRSKLPDDKIKELTGWSTKVGALINRVYPKKNSEAYRQYLEYRKYNTDSLHSNYYKHLVVMYGAIEAVKYELKNGLLDKLTGLIQADIFADFLEMGEHLLKEGYKDAAAVIIGSVLEDSLRKLCDMNDIKTINDKGKNLTIEPLNIELAKIEIYNQLVKKQITSWADLRNNAAHGHFGEYDSNQVQNMLQFVTAFTADYLK